MRARLNKSGVRSAHLFDFEFCDRRGIPRHNNFPQGGTEGGSFFAFLFSGKTKSRVEHRLFCYHD